MLINNNYNHHSPSPYYSTTSFVLFAPLAVLYSIASHCWYRLRRLRPHPLPPPPLPPASDVSSSSSSSKIAIVTGSNTGIGLETARTLVLDYDMTVILACRSRDKAVQAAARINADQRARPENTAPKNPNNRRGQAIVLPQPLDLSSFASVRAFATAVKERYTHIDILINNAGRNTSGESDDTSKQNNDDGQPLDLLFQSNFLGHYLLTAELMEVLVAQPPHHPTGARIIQLASVMHHFASASVSSSSSTTKTTTATTTPMDVTRVQDWTACALAHEEPTDTYSLSKLAAILFTLALNQRYGTRHHGITAIAVNPGAVNSDIWRDTPRFLIPLFALVYLNVQQGSQTSVAAAVLPMDDWKRSCQKDNDNDALGGATAVPYLQPYWMPSVLLSSSSSWLLSRSSSQDGFPFPLLEMLGPFHGHVWTRPRLPADPATAQAAADALWKASQELTQSTWL